MELCETCWVEECSGELRREDGDPKLCQTCADRRKEGPGTCEEPECGSELRAHGVGRALKLCHKCWVSKGRPWPKGADSCTECDGELRLHGAARAMKLCHRCWKEKGRPWDPNGPDTCKQCGGQLRQRGPARYFKLCNACYIANKDTESTWTDVAGLSLAELPEGREYSHSTVYIGNVFYKITEDELWHWLEEWWHAGEDIVIKRCQYKRDGHYVYGKVSRTFAFIEFEQVRHAAMFRADFDGRVKGGRTLRTYPAVKPLPGGRWGQEHAKKRNQHKQPSKTESNRCRNKRSQHHKSSSLSSLSSCIRVGVHADLLSGMQYAV